MSQPLLLALSPTRAPQLPGAPTAGCPQVSGTQHCCCSCHQQTAPHCTADKGRCCFLPSVLGQRALNPKGISRGLIRLEMPSGRLAPGHTCCHPGPGCSDGPRAEMNSFLAQLPLSSSMGTQSRTLLHNQTSQKESSVLSSSCYTQCHQRLMALSCLELEYQSNSSHCL